MDRKSERGREKKIYNGNKTNRDRLTFRSADVRDHVTHPLLHPVFYDHHFLLGAATLLPVLFLALVFSVFRGGLASSWRVGGGGGGGGGRRIVLPPAGQKDEYEDECEEHPDDGKEDDDKGRVDQRLVLTC